MVGSPYERVQRCREKARRRRHATQGSPAFPIIATGSQHVGLADLAGPSTSSSTLQVAEPSGQLAVPQKRPTLNRRRRIAVMRSNRTTSQGPVCGVSMPAALPLDKAYVEEMKEAYAERSYFGGPTQECPFCGAFFWFQEQIKSTSNVAKRKIVYNLCCRGGKINLKPYKKPPAPLDGLLKFDGDARSKRFLRQIRSYNSLFAFTSLGANIDKTINNGTAPYVFKINGVFHHRIGSLVPQRGTKPKFAQLYIYDTEHEAQNRLGLFEVDGAAANQPDPTVALALLDMLNEHNSLVKAFRYARERLEQEGDQKVTLRLLGCNSRDDVQYNLPTNGEIAAIIVGDYSADEYTYDVLVHDRNSRLKRVSCLHPCYMALQYPLLFPYGEPGYHLGIKYSDADEEGVLRKYVTMLEFGRFHMHYRLNEANPFTCYGRLSDQIVVDFFSTVEGSRLKWIADHQKELRYESVQGIADAIDKGFTSADSVGGRSVVPASFTGGRRYFVMNYQDAMAICRVFGPHDLFVTFTCNTKWKEIVDAMRYEPGQLPSDRSDLIVRVFHMKVSEFIEDIREGRTFGPFIHAGSNYLLLLEMKQVIQNLFCLDDRPNALHRKQLILSLLKTHLNLSRMRLQASLKRLFSGV